MHVRSARCVEHDLHMIAPARIGDSSWRSEEIVETRIAPCNAIFIVIFVVVIIIIIVIIIINAVVILLVLLLLLLFMLLLLLLLILLLLLLLLSCLSVLSRENSRATVLTKRTQNRPMVWEARDDIYDFKKE